jgi:hypothetical protein
MLFVRVRVSWKKELKPQGDEGTRRKTSRLDYKAASVMQGQRSAVNLALTPGHD